VPNFLVIFCSILILLNFINRWISTNHFPLSNLYESLLFLTLALLIFLIYFQFTLKKNFVGVLILPIVLFINTFATFTLPLEMQQPTSLVPALQSNWLMMHVTIMMLSYAALIFGSLLAITFLIVRYILKDKIKNLNIQNEELPFRAEVALAPSTLKDRQHGEATPKMENQYSTFRLIKNIDIIYDLDNLSYRVLTFGFPLLTIGILSGSVWANETWGSYWNWDPKETWALITWFVYAIYLHSRIIKGWSGTKPALIATFGFVTVWICYLGVNVFAKGLHSYGWFFTN
jgi:cytochrome c-type biogenesis protein CcsB